LRKLGMVLVLKTKMEKKMIPPRVA